jgi:hypothetical protein
VFVFINCSCVGLEDELNQVRVIVGNGVNVGGLAWILGCGVLS